MSYARNSCARNYRRYTACANHQNERHSGQDWKECSCCTGKTADWGGENTAWYCTNNYCTGERIEQDKVPDFESSVCIKCNKHVKLQLESYSPADGEARVICGSCPF